MINFQLSMFLVRETLGFVMCVLVFQPNIYLWYNKGNMYELQTTIEQI